MLLHGQHLKAIRRRINNMDEDPIDSYGYDEL